VIVKKMYSLVHISLLCGRDFFMALELEQSFVSVLMDCFLTQGGPTKIIIIPQSESYE